jgi:hypothetical protein
MQIIAVYISYWQALLNVNLVFLSNVVKISQQLFRIKIQKEKIVFAKATSNMLMFGVEGLVTLSVDSCLRRNDKGGQE